MVRNIFNVFNSSGASFLSKQDLRGLLLALDVNVEKDGPELQNMLRHFPDGLQFETLRDMIRDHVFYRIQDGRHFVALSLREAATLRSLIHSSVAGGVFMHQSVFGQNATGVALRVGYN